MDLSNLSKTKEIVLENITDKSEEYYFVKIVNSDLLKKDILRVFKNKAIAKVEIYNTIIKIITTRNLNDKEKKLLTEIIEEHDSLTTIKKGVESKILTASDFGKQVIIEYAAENVITGYSVDEIKIIMRLTNNVRVALETGSLYVALSELDKIPFYGTLVTESKIKRVRNKIQDFLGIPRT